MTITIHGIYRSRATRNLWLLLEAGVPFTLSPVVQAYRLPDPHAPGAPRNTLSPDFLALSPAGAVPVMTDGDLTLSESLAINLYLAKTYGGALGPQNLAEDALMTQWALYGATGVEPDAVGVMYVHMDKRQDSDAGRSEIADRTARLQRPLRLLDAHFAGQDWLVGGRFTVADINLAEILRYATTEPGLVEAHPSVKAWLDRCQSRPAFKEMWARRLAEPA
jgi:glutathione S-transferase